MTVLKKVLMERPQAGPPVPPPNPSSEEEEVEQDSEPTMDQVHIPSQESTARVPPPVVQPSPSSSELPPSPASTSSELPKWNPH
ncbi:hypothetical protein Tco_0580405 [Tanacetum coccineum]